MNWQNVINSIKGVAPQLAGMLVGGPVGAVAGQLLAGALGTEPEPAAIMNALTNDPQALEKVRNLELEHFKVQASVLNTALVQDAITPHTTRPKIALQSFQISAFASIIAISVWAVSVLTGETSLNESWPFVATIITPFAILVRGYMGILRDESANKLNGANGIAAVSGGLVGKLFKR